MPPRAPRPRKKLSKPAKKVMKLVGKAGQTPGEARGILKEIRKAGRAPIGKSSQARANVYREGRIITAERGQAAGMRFNAAVAKIEKRQSNMAKKRVGPKAAREVMNGRENTTMTGGRGFGAKAPGTQKRQVALTNMQMKKKASSPKVDGLKKGKKVSVATRSAGYKGKTRT